MARDTVEQSRMLFGSDLRWRTLGKKRSLFNFFLKLGHYKPYPESPTTCAGIRTGQNSSPHKCFHEQNTDPAIRHLPVLHDSPILAILTANNLTKQPCISSNNIQATRKL
ncbi:hypothetical protein V8G54_007108 [Vigna mungo]|uniref:Uncharacterized protein n=1 Tax=Vigna mungo TaxID=3915 RepID=A0AAQ3S8P0_VIGMU